MKTVNIIEIPDKSTMAIAQLVAFPDDYRGNAQAEELFGQLVRENLDDADDSVDAERMGELFEDGYYENGTYYVAIVHSTPDHGG